MDLRQLLILHDTQTHESRTVKVYVLFIPSGAYQRRDYPFIVDRLSCRAPEGTERYVA